MKRYRFIAYFLILLSFATIAAQDATCGAVVQQALDTVDSSCAATGRNQACYGYLSLQATPRAGVQDFNFARQGDLVNVVDLDRLRLSRFDLANQTWGIALLKLQANLPDNLPGMNVAFLIFGDVQITNAAEPETTDAPMQAFYFESGITQTSCEQAPQDGILIQTPKGIGQINLRANDVDIRLGSTAFLQAQPNGSLTISVVEGEGQVTALGKTVDVPAGTQVLVPMADDLTPAGAPGDAQPYDTALVAPLPVRLLPEQITIAPPALDLTPEATAAVEGSSYEAQTIMQVSDATLSGTICALDQPFTIHIHTAYYDVDTAFTPTDATHGSWEYTLQGSNVDGSYSIGEPAADGSRQMTFEGEDYVLGLVPTTVCAP